MTGESPSGPGDERDLTAGGTATPETPADPLAGGADAAWAPRWTMTGPPAAPQPLGMAIPPAATAGMSPPPSHFGVPTAAVEDGGPLPDAPLADSWHLQGLPFHSQYPTPYPRSSAEWAWPPNPWSAPPWAQPAPPRPHSRAAIAAGAVVLLLVSGGTGAAVARVTARSTASTPVTQATNLPGAPGAAGATTPGGAGAGSGGTAGGSASNPATSGGATTGGAASIADVPSVVDPAIVDVTSTLADGSGVAAGTGMVITSGGEVLTNNHVISGGGTITVLIGGSGAAHPATVVGDDPTADVALLQIQGVSGLTTITSGDSTQLQVSQPVVALGNALGKQGTPAVAQGTITALDQQITASDDQGNAEQLTGLIETNANIQPGDSGGPLADSTGRVVGMDTAATVGRSRFRIGSASSAYAIPINTAMAVVRQIESGSFGGSIQHGNRPIIGVEISSSSTGGSGTLGAQVVGVQAGGPAASAGIVTGDTIVAVNGAQVGSSADLGTAIQKHGVGDTISIAWVDRSGAQHTASLTLVAGPPA